MTESVSLYAFADWAGRLYVSEQPGQIPAANEIALCCECFGKWAIWKLRLGYDVHSHPRSENCGPSCGARQGGRFLQALAMRSANPEDIFWIQKTLDGLPNVNGSTSLSANRVLTFLHPNARYRMYESLAGVDALKYALLIRGELSDLDLPNEMTDGFTVSFEIFESARSAKHGVISAPAPGERSLGLHSVFVVGYEASGDVVLFQNSWGAGWGRAGRGKVSMDYLSRYMHEAWVSRPALWGPTPEKASRLISISKERRQFRELWMVRNPVWQVPLARRPEGSWRLRLFETNSPSLGCAVECLQVANGYGMLLGWSFIYHRPSGLAASEIRELFVMPPFRRLHVGSILEAASVERATEWQSDTVELLFNEADSGRAVRAAGRMFGVARGYEWRWRQNRSGPRIVARGTKALAVQR